MGSRVMVFGATSFMWRVGLQKTKTPRMYLSVKASLPDVPILAQTARISLTPQEVDDFAPKIQQVVHWFGQLQAIDLESVEPSIRPDTQGYNSREDLPQVFGNRQAIVDEIPSYEDPYIKIPKVLNKE